MRSYSCQTCTHAGGYDKKRAMGLGWTRRKESKKRKDSDERALKRLRELILGLMQVDRITDWGAQ